MGPDTASLPLFPQEGGALPLPCPGQGHVLLPPVFMSCWSRSLCLPGSVLVVNEGRQASVPGIYGLSPMDRWPWEGALGSLGLTRASHGRERLAVWGSQLLLSQAVGAGQGRCRHRRRGGDRHPPSRGALRQRTVPAFGLALPSRKPDGLYFAVLPSFTKIPHDIAIRTGTTARLECAASGHPNPQIAWQKDGGTDFPAARERRMHVMPDDDVFFITNVKLEDMGVYSCTAQNSAGIVSANATLTVFGPSTHTLSLGGHACVEGARGHPFWAPGCGRVGCAAYLCVKCSRKC